MLDSLRVSEAFPGAGARTGGTTHASAAIGARARLRLLITGDRAALAGVLPIIDRHCPGPIHLYDATTIPLVPSFSRGTVLLAEVERLAAAEQDRLFDWLTEHGASHPFIVATSRAPLWPLLERGSFRADLFYRLNLVSIPAQPGACLEAISLAAAPRQSGDVALRGVDSYAVVGSAILREYE